MKSILSFFSISFNEHSLYDLKNPKMDPKYLKRTDFGKIKFYVAKKKKEKIDIQIPTTVPTSKRTCQSDCLSSNRKRNGVPAFFSPDACANKVQTINRTAMQMYAVLQVVKKKRFISWPCEIDQPFMTMKQKTWLACKCVKIFFFFFCDRSYKNIKRYKNGYYNLCKIYE